MAVIRAASDAGDGSFKRANSLPPFMMPDKVSLDSFSL